MPSSLNAVVTKKNESYFIYIYIYIKYKNFIFIFIGEMYMNRSLFPNFSL